MAFSESVKLEVKRRAHFKCCRCQNIGVDVHHITPEKDSGADDIGNAAPLCQTCHDQFGDNPSKRKEIRQMRDWWYGVCAERFKAEDMRTVEEINAKLDAIQKGTSQDLAEVKGLLKDLAGKAIDGMTTGTAGAITSGVVNFAAVSTSGVKLGESVYANVICRKCGTSIGLLVGSNLCPNCHSPIVSQ